MVEGVVVVAVVVGTAKVVRMVVMAIVVETAGVHDVMIVMADSVVVVGVIVGDRRDCWRT